MRFCYVWGEEMKEVEDKLTEFVRFNVEEWRRNKNYAYICAKFVYGCTLLGQDILGT